MDAKKAGQNIARLRKAKSMTQKQLAAIAVLVFLPICRFCLFARMKRTAKTPNLCSIKREDKIKNAFAYAIVPPWECYGKM